MFFKIVSITYECSHMVSTECFSYNISELDDEIYFSAQCFLSNPFDDNDVYNSLINAGGPKPISIENKKIDLDEMIKLRELAGRYGISSIFTSFKPQRCRAQKYDETTCTLRMKWSDGDLAQVDSVGSVSGVLRTFFEELTRRVAVK